MVFKPRLSKKAPIRSPVRMERIRSRRIEKWGSFAENRAREFITAHAAELRELQSTIDPSDLIQIAKMTVIEITPTSGPFPSPQAVRLRINRALSDALIAEHQYRQPISPFDLRHEIDKKHVYGIDFKAVMESVKDPQKKEIFTDAIIRHSKSTREKVMLGLVFLKNIPPYRVSEYMGISVSKQYIDLVIQNGLDAIRRNSNLRRTFGLPTKKEKNAIVSHQRVLHAKKRRDAERAFKLANRPPQKASAPESREKAARTRIERREKILREKLAQLSAERRQKRLLEREKRKKN